jgi:predicted DNA-binding protein YlxM (UPF0122 family)
MKTEISKLQWQILKLWNPYGKDLKLRDISKRLNLSYNCVRNEIDKLRKSKLFGDKIKFLSMIKQREIKNWDLWFCREVYDMNDIIDKSPSAMCNTKVHLGRRNSDLISLWDLLEPEQIIRKW